MSVSDHKEKTVVRSLEETYYVASRLKNATAEFRPPIPGAPGAPTGGVGV